MTLTKPGVSGILAAKSFRAAQDSMQTACLRVLLTALALIAEPAFPADSTYPFTVQTERSGDEHLLVARNNGPAPVSVKVSIPDANNIETDRTFPVYAVVPPKGELFLGRVHAAIARMSYTFRTQATWILGDFNAEHHPDATYRLPYKDGQTHRLGQSPGGPITTHDSAESAYAVDVQLPEGTPVVAARDGIVIETEAGQTYGGQNPDLLPKANHVRILHHDGTIANYAHLAHGGVFVYAGQRVAVGTEIGLAGSTGYSSGPHLHFAVQTVQRTGDGFAVVSVPFQFHVGNPPVAFSPEFGMLAKADYASPGQVPGFGRSTQSAHSAPTVRGAASDSGRTSSPDGPSIYIEVPAPLRQFLLRISVWQWAGALLSIWVILLGLRTVRQSRRERAWTDLSSIDREPREPAFRSR